MAFQPPNQREANRRRLEKPLWPDPPLLHVYGPFGWHDEVRIVGDSDGLLALRAAIDAALATGEFNSGKTDAFTADGEGFAIRVTRDDSGWSSGSWGERERPYIDDIAAGRSRREK